jgi:hypothetical protein
MSAGSAPAALRAWVEPSEEVRRRIESSVSWRRTQQFTQGRAIPPGTRMDAAPVRPCALVET